MLVHRLALLLFLSLAGHVTVASAQESSFLQVEGAVLHYKEFGKGQPFVIVGGIAGLSSEYLEPFAVELGKRFRCFLIDQRGTGGSEVLRLDTSTVNVPSVVADVEALRRHLKVPSWGVVGHSWGGAVAITYAATHPDVVSSLILVGPAGVDISFLTHYGYNVVSRMTAQDSAYYNTGNQYAAADRNRMNVIRYKATLPSFVADRKHARAIERFVTDTSYRPLVAQTYWTAFMNKDNDYTVEFAARPVPTVIIQGDRDPVDLRTARKLEMMIKGSTVEVLMRCGAFPWVEKPKEFWQKIDAFRRTLQRR